MNKIGTRPLYLEHITFKNEYTVGNLCCPSPDDAKFETLADAIAHIKNNNEEDNEIDIIFPDVYGIWIDSDLIHIHYDGVLFS